MDAYLMPGVSYMRLEEEYLKYGSLVIAVDFDDTLFDYHGKGHTFELMFQLVRDLKAMNCVIIIWTGNQKTQMIEEYLKEKNVPYDLINEDSDVAKEFVIQKGYPQPRKVYANCYLDDRAGLLQAYVDLRQLIVNHSSGIL